MRTVNISDLKAQLSAHIQLVKDGEEVLVCDRNKPVARIIPCHLQDHLEQGAAIIARGVLTLPLKKRPASVSWPEPSGMFLTTSWSKHGEKNGRPVTRLSAFWDASALVPLCVRQDYASGYRPVRQLRCNRLVGNPLSRLRVRSPDS